MGRPMVFSVAIKIIVSAVIAFGHANYEYSYSTRMKMLPCGFATFFFWLGLFPPRGSWVGLWFSVWPSK